MKGTYKKSTDQMTDRWLRQNGLSPETFAQTDILLLKALKAAFHTLKNYGDLLDHKQTVTLNVYRLAMANRAQRSRLQARDAHAVLNITTAIQRKVFKRMRLIKQKRQALIKASVKYKYSGN